MLEHRTVSDIQKLRSFGKSWETLRKMCKGPAYQSFDWTNMWLKHFGNLASPRLILVNDGEDIVGILPLVQTVTTLMGMRLKRLSFFGNCSNTAESYNHELLCVGNQDEVLDQMIEALRELDWNLLQLCDLRDTSLSTTLCERIAEEWQTDEIPKTPCPHAYLSATGDVIDIIGSRTRRTIRHVISSLKNENRIVHRIEESPDGVAEAMRTYAELHRDRWGKRGGSIFADENISSFLIDIARKFAETGSGRVYEIRIDGTVASQLFCIDDWECMRAYRIGMNDSMKEFSPGNLVAYFAMQDAQKRGFGHLDFGKGAEEFKYRMGAKDTYLVGVEAKKGSLRIMSKIASLPGVKEAVERTGVKDSALKKMYERT